VKRRRVLGAFAAAVGVFFASVALIAIYTQGIARPMTWEIPEGYRGWILAQFGDGSCPPMRLDGVFDVLAVGPDGRACTSSSLQRGWQYVRYEAIGLSGRKEIDRNSVTPWAVNNELQRKTLFVGARDQADPQQLPPDWR
jgi:hypothetical protein